MLIRDFGKISIYQEFSYLFVNRPPGGKDQSIDENATNTMV